MAVVEKLKIQFQDIDLQTKAAGLALASTPNFAGDLSVQVMGQTIPNLDRYRLSDVAKWIGSFEQGNRSSGPAALAVNGSAPVSLTLTPGKTVPFKKQEAGVHWHANPLEELLGNKTPQVPNFGARNVGPTSADAQFEKAVSMLLGGKMPASPPALDICDLLGVAERKLSSAGTVKAGVQGLDGDNAKVFLKTFKRLCENPEQLLL